MPATTDTIVAVSSPPGRAPRGLLRLSGPVTGQVLAGMLACGSADPSATPRRLTAVRVRIDPHGPHDLAALSVFLDAPRTFTGQDMAEVQCPGNPALLERLLRQCLAHGARLAEPGEFTFRAFAAGKLDLTQAEGVSATIAAVSDSQLQAAGLLRHGRLGRLAQGLADRLASQLALIEAGIDFTDQEDVVAVSPAALEASLAGIGGEIQELLARSRSWVALEALPRVVLAGAPNAGKSTLFNALLGRTRAVVSPLPGATRDLLAEPLTLVDEAGRPVEVMLLDMAGLDRRAGDLIARQAQAAARRALEQADLVLLVADGSRTPGTGELPTMPLPEQHCLRVWTKADACPPPASPPGIAVSALTGQGLDELRRAILAGVSRRAVSVQADLLALQPRHETALRSAAEHLSQARDLLAPQLARRHLDRPELTASHVRAALDDLAHLAGALSPDEVIGRVFATFCVGK